MQRLHLIITGRVHGVWFRASTQDQAIQLGLTGWVKNLPHGAVEAVAEGPQEQLNIFHQWCHQGPPLAHVDQVQAQWGPATGEFTDFLIK